MAYLDFTSVTQTSITVRIAGLDLTSQSNMGTSNRPRHNSYKISCIGDIRSVSKGSGGKSGPVTYSGLAAGTTYDFAGIVNFTDINNNTSNVQFYDICATESKPAPTRPANWAWWSTVAQDRPIRLSAAEWNAFYDRIDAFRNYVGFGSWPNFIPVSRGTPISAAIVNEVRAAIAPMTTEAMPPYVAAGKTPISASYFNQLKDYLNSVR